ncbi:MAG: hypothetical protein IKP52_02460 [Prevotella sp.]|nr:hypothetical protein [Prevotella sp.]
MRLLGALLLLLTACSGSDDISDTPITPDNKPVAVTFSTDISTGTTRATTGMINNLDALKASGDGFGVFAYLTDGTAFNTQFPNAAAYTSFSNFFMQNQQVTWNNSYQEGGVWQKDWVYSPLKYWPNYTNNNNSDPGPRYISFFAYAPWADVSTSPTEGVINYVRDADRTPHVIYKIGTADHQVDLLWANKIDATRNGQGLINDATSPLTYQKVPLQFHHALSAIDIYVQRVYDEPAYTGKIPAAVLYPTLYVSKLELKSTDVAGDSKNGLQTSGKLSLIDGTWSDPGAPNAWADNSEVKITYDESMINDTIRGTTDTREEFIRDIELDKWKWILDTKGTDDTSDDEWVDATTITEEQYAATPNRWKNAYGVSEEERNFIKNSMTQVLIPRKITLIPKLTYSMVVRDDNLQLNYLTDTDNHRYTRILNEVEGNSVTLDLKAGKRYTLLIRIGVEHITFELLSVVDWDFPMRFNPDVVTGFENEEIGHTVNE